MIVLSNCIYNSGNLEETQMLISWWMDKQIVVHPWNGILLCNIKEWTMGKHSMIESQKHYVNCKEPYKTDYLLYNSIHMKFWKKQTLMIISTSTVARGLGYGKRILIAKGRRDHFGLIGMFYILLVYIFQIVHLNLICFYLKSLY